MAPAPERQLDGSLLLQLVQTSTQTAEQVKALHDVMLGDHGHVKRFSDHVERLYDRDKDRTREIAALRDSLQNAIGEFRDALRESTAALRSNVQEAEAGQLTLRERMNGAWGLVLAVGVLVEIVAHGYQLLKGKP